MKSVIKSTTEQKSKIKSNIQQNCNQILFRRDKLTNFPEHLRPIPKPIKNDQEYYNDLEGKTAPDVPTAKREKSPKKERKRERISSNLIDLDTPINDHNYMNDHLESFEDLEDFGAASSEEN